MFNKHDISRDACQLFGMQAHKGYDWWWHSFTGYDAESGEAKPFFIEFFLCNPALGGEEPVFGQIPGKPQKPSYLMVKAGAWGEDAAQLHRFWGWKRIKVDWGVPFSIEADDCFLNETQTRGHVKVKESSTHPEWMCQDGEMSWNLNIRKITAFNVGFGADEVFRHAEYPQDNGFQRGVRRRRGIPPRGSLRNVLACRGDEERVRGRGHLERASLCGTP